MSESQKENFIVRAIKWFDPRWRSVTTWGFIFNRIAGLGLTFYLFLHLIMLGNLAKGPEAYDGFIAMVHNPLFLIGEVLVVSAGFIHGINGIRIGLNSFGIGVRYQKQMLVGALLIAVLASLYFAFRMFTA
ncbi:MAG: succinate dehydrogenase, cytochrome b556 subunit [Anaerolineae bacterium]|nr:succinate dehydrogenase, cytochrome b556 subunit [Anaerolineae bacterium]